jgi:uncharacterized repeat protein (TIGR01451 family)
VSAMGRERTWASRRVRAAYAALAVVALVLCCSASAFGAVSFQLVSVSNTTVAPGATLGYLVQISNVGDDSTDGTDVTFTATLPTEMSAVSASSSDGSVVCGVAAQIVTCVGPAFVGAHSSQSVEIIADVDPGAAGVLTAQFDVAGGGASSAAHTVDPVRISAAEPGFGIDAFDGLVSDAAGSPVTQAGGHPDLLTTSIDFNSYTDPSVVVGARRPVEDVKDVRVDLPPGLVGSVKGLDECTLPELANGLGASDPRPLCPVTSQVGVTNIRIESGTPGLVPVFNMLPPAGVPARFGFNVFGNVVVLDAALNRTDDGGYGLSVRASDIPQGLAINGTTFTFWGVPSDPSHKPQRACSGESNPAAGGPTCDSGAPRKAFFRNPTSCTGGVGLPTTVTIDSWLDPADFKQATFVSHDPPGYPLAPQDWGPQQGTDGCDTVPFTPVLRSQPAVGAKAGAPAAFAFDVEIPQSDDPVAVAQSDLKKAVVTLPRGVRVSPSSADGLGACSSAQIALDTTALPTCPDTSKLGTVTIDTPLIAEPVTGHVFLATPFDNPFKQLVAVYIVASARGVVIKLPGQVSMDPDTGQITTTFDDNPQLPFSRLHLEFSGGSRAALVAPKRCGTYVTHAVLTGWNGRTVTSDSNFTLTENAKGKACPSTFSPGFSAGTESNGAGRSSSFLMRFTREDSDQEFSSLTVNLPRGLTGKIANADLCRDAQVRADACPANAKIGDVTVGAGAGSSPFFITNGRAYLTESYKGAPFGVAIVVPAVAGPFDLGKVTVRSALFVDKHTANVRIVSDPFPTILQGIPLDVRDVRVNVNKPSFFINPTSCAVKTIAGTLTSTEGAKANVSDRFQAADCGSLGFKPSMTMRVGGRGHTRRGRTSSFSTTLRMPRRGQTNLRFVRVTLPQTINARLNTINDACSRAEFESDVKKCAHAKAGTAVASTPLLRRSLSGNVYFVKNGHPIPDLFVALRGQVDFDLIGRITIPGGKRLATTFDAAPDVPIRAFTLRLLGGPRTASIGAAANLCSARSRRAKAEVDYIGQNGRVRQVEQALKVGGCAKKGQRTGRQR